MTMTNKRTEQRRTLILLTAFFVFLLLLSYGFPVTGDDWYFTSRHQNESLPEALRRAYTIAGRHAEGINGRYLGNFLVGLLGCSEPARQVVRSLTVVGLLALLWLYARVEGTTRRIAAAALLLGVPTAIYAQVYAWSAGFLNYVPPAALALVYLIQCERCLSDMPPRETVLSALPMFLLGLLSQFFVENVTIGLCLLSIGVFFLRWKKQGFSWRLAGYLLGAILGCVLMFFAPGYRRTNTDADTYRTIGTSLTTILRLAAKNTNAICNYLTVGNWLLLVPLTLLAAALLRPFDERLRRGKMLLLLCLLLPPIFFLVKALFLRQLSFHRVLQTLTAGTTVLMTLLWLLGVVLTTCRYARNVRTRRCMLLCVSCAVLCTLPLMIVSPVSARCAYFQDIMLLCMLLLLMHEVLPRFPLHVRKRLCVPVLTASAVLMGCLLWVSLWNGRAEAIRVSYTEKMIASGAVHITLPRYPYEEYVFGTESVAIGYYYYYDEPCDITFELRPYAWWGWNEAEQYDKTFSGNPHR